MSKASNQDTLDIIYQLLEMLEQLGKVSSEQLYILKDYYKNDTRNIDIIKKELKRLFEEPDYVHDKILEIKKSNKARKIIAVDDISKNGKSYIKLQYDDGSIRIFESNLTEKGSVMFEVLKQNPYNDMTNLFEALTQNANEVDPQEFEPKKSIGSSKGNQKRLGAHPQAGKFFHSDTDGFMNLVFFIFLTGIGIGISLMIFINIFVK